jgi:hypothetical protein
MLPVAWLLASALVVAGGAPSSEPEIRASGGEVTIHAQNLPLSQILDRLSSATGMALTYDGSRPTTPVTVSVDGISEAEAILKLMEGLGVSYVFRTDATGQRVDLLIVSGSGPGPLVAAAPPSAAAESQYEEPVADYGHIPLDPAVAEAAGGQGKPDLSNPYLGLPAQYFPQAAPAQQGDPTGSSQGTGARSMPSGPMPSAPMPPAPAFPQGASYPAR